MENWGDVEREKTWYITYLLTASGFPAGGSAV